MSSSSINSLSAPNFFFDEAESENINSIDAEDLVINPNITSLIEALPKRFHMQEGAPLRIIGDLDLKWCRNLKALPEGLQVEGSLDLSDCINLEALPTGLQIEGDLKFSNCIRLNSLPADLLVYGNLDISSCIKLESLLSGLQVKGSLNVNGCINLKTLPEGLRIGRNLNLESCTSLKTLPADLRVGENLILNCCTRLEALPADIRVKENASFHYCTSLKNLPANLWIRGNLDLSDCVSLKDLPAGLRVGRTLDLSGCIGLETLPVDFVVGENLVLSNCTNLISLSQNNLRVKNLNLRGCTNVGILPDNVQVSETLNLSHCTTLATVPPNLQVGKYLNLTSCRNLTTLPNDLRVGANCCIDCSNCTSLRDLPACLSNHGGRVILMNTGLSQEILNGLRQNRNFVLPPPQIEEREQDRITEIVPQETTVESAFDFWKELAHLPTTNLPSVLDLDQDQIGTFTRFLQRLKGTAEYKESPQTREALARRILDLFVKMAQDTSFCEGALSAMVIGLRDCHDLAGSLLESLHLTMIEESLKSREDITEAELKETALGFMRLQAVDEAAQDRIKELKKQIYGFREEVEVLLAFRTRLKERLDLPLAIGHMLYRESASTNSRIIDEVGEKIAKETTNNEEKLATFLSTWEPWQVYDRRIHYPAYEDLQRCPEEHRPVGERPECSIITDKVPEGKLVCYVNPLHPDNKYFYNYDNFKDIYVAQGTCPFTRDTLSLINLYRVDG